MWFSSQGLIPLGVTVLRLVGELQHWPSVLFSASPGGGGAIIGISWLPLIFGPYFALKLAGAGEGPTSAGKSIGFAALGLLVMAGGATLFGLSGFQNTALLIGGLLLIAASIAVPFLGWPALTKSLIAYGYMARIPVAVVMYFALQGDWHTHYDGLPPNLPPGLGFWAKYLMIGLVPQLVGWIAFTVISGSLFGAIVVAIKGRGKVAAPASS